MQKLETKAWKDWVERDKQRGMENARRMEKQEKLSQSWEMVKMCREIIKENYSNWQERKVIEEERQEIHELTLARGARLEKKQKQKKENFRNSMETVNKEVMFQRRIQLAETKENTWNWRRTRTSRDEHSNRLGGKARRKKKEISEKG